MDLFVVEIKRIRGWTRWMVYFLLWKWFDFSFENVAEDFEWLFLSSMFLFLFPTIFEIIKKLFHWLLMNFQQLMKESSTYLFYDGFVLTQKSIFKNINWYKNFHFHLLLTFSYYFLKCCKTSALLRPYRNNIWQISELFIRKNTKN